MRLPELETLDTFPKLLLHNAANWPDAIALREKEFGIWNEFSWVHCRDRVREIAYGLKALGLERGEVVAIVGRNRPNWLWSELAAHCVGCMTLGIYEDVLAQEAGYLLDFAQARVVVCEDEEQVDKILELDREAASLRWIVYHDDRGMRKYADPRLVGWQQLLHKGAALAGRHPGLIDAEIAAGRGQDVAVLCTTSGTTAHPKLAMLQFRPFLEHIAAYLRADPREPEDEYVSILPMPWIMEQVYVVAMPLLSRIRVSFPESQETVMRDLREIGPTHVLLAPRVWEQTAADLRSRIMDAGSVTRHLFDWAVRRGVAAVEKGRRHRTADLLVFAALRDRLGFSRLKSAATGGAALGPDTFRFFLAMGVPLKQLYGQTEAAGAYTLQVHPGIDTDSSGVPFDDTHIRIRDPDENGVGEILTRHAGLFAGYFGSEAASREAFTTEGWMATGDAGFLDEKGRLTVIDRMSDIATTSAGTRFSPQFIENKLKFSPYIGECVVLGNARPWLAAILCIRYSMVAKWAEASRIGFTTYQNLAGNERVQGLLAGEVEKVNASLPEAQRIRRFLLLYKELDPDDGELTRTRKVRRGVIDERYAGLIQAIYAGRDMVHVETEVTFEDGRKGRIVADLAIHDSSAHRLVPKAA
ncbi:AMP-binding protein [Marinimicrococcus flavescens]|uniref:AMP-binding protein n=1 Tax=Marinimicrococcus flavescens TaxID=3031815 RepID=A0AAP3UXA5_9PROT|nr:AMP-binding protein [Marinimicrococcus flavescens]